jgi:hypothetical protein
LLYIFLYIGIISMLYTLQSNKKTSHSNTTNTICFYVLIYLDVVNIQKGNAMLFLKKKIVWVQKPFRAIIIECEEWEKFSLCFFKKWIIAISNANVLFIFFVSVVLHSVVSYACSLFELGIQLKFLGFLQIVNLF